jgi:hypothetical protein
MFCFVDYTGVVINFAGLNKSVNRHNLEHIIHQPNTNKNKETTLAMLKILSSFIMRASKICRIFTKMNSDLGKHPKQPGPHSNNKGTVIVSLIMLYYYLKMLFRIGYFKHKRNNTFPQKQNSQEPRPHYQSHYQV